MDAKSRNASSPRIRSKVNWVQILVYTSDVTVFIDKVSTIINKSGAKSPLDNTALQYQ